MSTTQSILHAMEEGKGRIALLLIPFSAAVAAVFLIYNFAVYRGLADAQSMDNAQLAREISRGDGFTTKFIRPYALGQLSGKIAAGSPDAAVTPKLFPRDKFPIGTPRLLPDTYNAPGYPMLLAGWFALLRPDFGMTPAAISAAHMYPGDRVIPWLNQIFLLLTAGLVFLMGRRLFDLRVAWMALIGYLVSDLVWQYSITGLSTSFLMFLVTTALLIATEIFSAGEVDPESGETASPHGWIWALVLGVVLGAACLTRLNVLVLLVPIGGFLCFVPRANLLFIPLVAVIVLAMVAPWFWHMTSVSGNPLGSTAELLELSPDETPGNEVYTQLETPKDLQLFKNVSKKELAGFLWHFNHAWELLGSSPLVLLFAASLLYHFRRPRVQALRWLVAASAILLIAVNNFGLVAPGPVSAWNVVIVLFPAMTVVGSAFFFILLDRLELGVPLLNRAVAVIVLVITAFPLLLTLLKTGGYGSYNYPPYAPFYIKFLGQAVHSDDWVTTDMPWAIAWYADRPSLWLPDTVDEFDRISVDYCSSGMLLLTPVILSEPVSNLTSGGDKDWFPFIYGTTAPTGFPLSTRVSIPNSGLAYIVWTRPSL
jgi:hypothetical protein